VEERDAVDEEEQRHDERQAGEIPLDDVSASLGRRREAQPAIPASRPLCMSTSETSTKTSSTWTTARKLVTRTG
jgi:hypothetical protein